MTGVDHWWDGIPNSRLIAGRRYLTNMHRSEIDLVAEAIQKSGRQDIHIDPDPMPGTQNFLFNQNYFSIWVEFPL